MDNDKQNKYTIPENMKQTPLQHKTEHTHTHVHKHVHYQQKNNKQTSPKQPRTHDENDTRPEKNWLTAVLLSFLLGYLGIDRFYLGQTKLGVIKLATSWCTFYIWPIIDFIIIVTRQIEQDTFRWDDE